MIRKLFVSLSILAISFNGYSQSVFQKIYQGSNSSAFGTQQTSDGGYIVVGYTQISATDFDFLVIKTNAGGDTTWTHTYGGIGDEEAAAVQQTTDGGYVIVGTDSSSGLGGYNVYVVKINSTGDTSWTKSFGGSANEFPQAIQQTADGGYIITGYTNSFSQSNLYNDIYLLKTDVSGNLVWSKTYGGIYNDYAYSVKQTADGGYIMAGYTNSFGLSTNGAHNDAYLLKTDANGILAWSRTYGRSGEDGAYGLAITYDKGYVITGFTSTDSLATTDDIYLLRTDINGDTLFTKSFGGGNYDQGTAIIQTRDSGIAICSSTYSFGSGSSDFYLIKTDKKGNFLFNQTYGGSNNDWPYTIWQSTDGGFDISGYTDNFGVNNANFFMIKTDSGGNISGSVGCDQTIPTPIIQSGVAIVKTYTNTTVTTPATNVASKTNTKIKTGGISVMDACLNVTGIKQTATNKYQFAVYPNPGNGNISVKTNNLSNNTQLTIYNQLGQLILTRQLTSELTNLSLDVNAGVYQIRILNDNELIYQTKIIKE
jgi:hypothetical protein